MRRSGVGHHSPLLSKEALRKQWGEVALLAEKNCGLSETNPRTRVDCLQISKAFADSQSVIFSNRNLVSEMAEINSGTHKSSFLAICDKSLPKFGSPLAPWPQSGESRVRGSVLCTLVLGQESSSVDSGWISLFDGKDFDHQAAARCNLKIREF